MRSRRAEVSRSRIRYEGKSEGRRVENNDDEGRAEPDGNCPGLAAGRVRLRGHLNCGAQEKSPRQRRLQACGDGGDHRTVSDGSKGNSGEAEGFSGERKGYPGPKKAHYGLATHRVGISRWFCSIKSRTIKKRVIIYHRCFYHRCRGKMRGTHSTQ